MSIKEVEKYKKDIAIILQTEQYKDVEEINEELIIQILGFLKDSEIKVDKFIKENQPKPYGEMTYSSEDYMTK